MSTLAISIFDIHRPLKLLSNILTPLINPVIFPMPETTTPILIYRSCCVLGAFRLHYSLVTQGSNDSPCMYLPCYLHHLLTKHSQGVGYYFWAFQCAEINIGIVCASLPPLKQLIGRFLPGFITRPSRQSHSSNLYRGRSRAYIDANCNNNNGWYTGSKRTYINIIGDLPNHTSANKNLTANLELRSLTSKDMNGILVVTRLDLETISKFSDL